MTETNRNGDITREVRSRIARTIRDRDLITAGDLVILGLSGGPDSSCLFDVLLSLREEMGFSLRTVHVNHGLRPGVCDEEQAFVESWCRREGVPCRAIRVDCHAYAEEHGLTDEEAGRELRYAAFYAEAVLWRRDLEGSPKDGAAVKICVAQNENDQAETILQRLVRGTGTDGLAGIPYKRKGDEDTLIVRPLLDVDRKSIEDYCLERDLSPRIDQSNLEPVYTRNKIRLELLPYLRDNFNPNIEETLARMGRIAAEDKAYLAAESERALAQLTTERDDTMFGMSRGRLAGLDPAIRHRVVRLALKELGLDRDVERTHLLAADRLLTSGKSSGTTEFPAGYTLRVSYETAEFLAPGQAPMLEEPEIRVRTRTAAGFYPGKGQAVFDLDALEQALPKGESLNTMLELRTRRPGDRIRTKGGTKTIQDLFVDDKVPAHLRDRLYLVAVGSEVLWIPRLPSGPRYSASYPFGPETARVLILELDGDV